MIKALFLALSRVNAFDERVEGRSNSSKIDLCRICAGFAPDLRRICAGFAPDLRRLCAGFADRSLKVRQIWTWSGVGTFSLHSETTQLRQLRQLRGGSTYSFKVIFESVVNVNGVDFISVHFKLRPGFNNVAIWSLKKLPEHWVHFKIRPGFNNVAIRSLKKLPELWVHFKIRPGFNNVAIRSLKKLPELSSFQHKARVQQRGRHLRQLSSFGNYYVQL